MIGYRRGSTGLKTLMWETCVYGAIPATTPFYPILAMVNWNDPDLEAKLGTLSAQLLYAILGLYGPLLCLQLGIYTLFTCGDSTTSEAASISMAFVQYNSVPFTQSLIVKGAHLDFTHEFNHHSEHGNCEVAGLPPYYLVCDKRRHRLLHNKSDDQNVAYLENQLPAAPLASPLLTGSLDNAHSLSGMCMISFVKPAYTSAVIIYGTHVAFVIDGYMLISTSHWTFEDAIIFYAVEDAPETRGDIFHPQFGSKPYPTDFTIPVSSPISLNSPYAPYSCSGLVKYSKTEFPAPRLFRCIANAYSLCIVSYHGFYFLNACTIASSQVVLALLCPSTTFERSFFFSSSFGKILCLRCVYRGLLFMKGFIFRLQPAAVKNAVTVKRLITIFAQLFSYLKICPSHPQRRSMSTLSTSLIFFSPTYGKHQNKDYVLSNYRPVVKFRNIEESVLQAVQTGSADDVSVTDIDGIADSDDEDGAEDELLESEIDGRQPAQAVAFEIHPDIDINSKALKDMVSTDPVSVVSTVDLSFVLSPQAATMVTDDGDADWNY
ncbi:uncharacterized protein F5147DRAFT_655991 [Suillus discolor]|uniref:Uncharacterized protein n=1 Tax=Suillus discolor TaxID=1912936 RepID=A0A9P7JQG2_9AGAM|nr:uncharacterized protein F5147DRAFT_655991 [Suillus discolor]KAG2098708.1 hypothetical protein F5147DRAFT_655991 [Suillus discolor]